MDFDLPNTKMYVDSTGFIEGIPTRASNEATPLITTGWASDIRGEQICNVNVI